MFSIIRQVRVVGLLWAVLNIETEPAPWGVMKIRWATSQLSAEDSGVICGCCFVMFLDWPQEKWLCLLPVEISKDLSFYTIFIFNPEEPIFFLIHHFCSFSKRIYQVNYKAVIQNPVCHIKKFSKNSAGWWEDMLSCQSIASVIENNFRMSHCFSNEKMFYYKFKC